MGDAAAAAAAVRLLLSVGRTRCAEPAATRLQSDTSSGVSNRCNEATRSPSTQLGTGTQPAAATTSTTTTQLGTSPPTAIGAQPGTKTQPTSTTQLGTSSPTAIGAQPGTKTQPTSATPTAGGDPRGSWLRPRRKRWFTANLGRLFFEPSDKQPRRLRQLRNSGTLKHHWSNIVAAVFMMVHTNAPCKLVCTFFKCSSQTVKRHVAKAQAERLKAWRLAQQLKRRLVESTASTAAAASSTTASSTTASSTTASSTTASAAAAASSTTASSTTAPAEVASAAYSKTGATHAAAAGSPWTGSFWAGSSWASNSRVHHIAIAPSSVHPSDLLVLVETSPKEKAVHQSEFTDDCFANQCNKAPWNCFADTNPEFWLKHDTSTGMVQPPSTCKAFFEKHAPKLVNVEYCNYALDVGFVASASKKSSSKASSRGSDPKLVAATQAVVSAGGSGSGVGAGAKRRRNSNSDSVQQDVPQKLQRSTATGADHDNSAATMTGPHGSAVPGSAGPAAGHATAPRSAAWQASASALAPAPAAATAAAPGPGPGPATWYATSTAPGPGPGPGPATWYATTGPATWYATTGPATWYATTATATATAGALGPADTVELAGMAAQIAQATQIVQTMREIALTQQRLMDVMTRRMNVQL